MQKILFSNKLIPIMMHGENLLNRADIVVFTAATTDDILKIHIEETLNLIVTMLSLPGTRSESIFEVIWQSNYLKKVRVIMICEDNLYERTRCMRCGAHVILTMPIDPDRIREQVVPFLSIASRQAHRVILKVSVEGKLNDQPFPCFMENISATGALISAARDLTAGDVISCSFYLPDGINVKTQAEVVRVSKQAGSGETLYGIRYTTIPAESIARIEAYIEKGLP